MGRTAPNALAIMPRVDDSERSRSAEMRIRRFEWHRSVAALLLAGATGALACVVLLPAMNVVPAADRTGAQGLAGARPPASLPAPTATGTAGAPATPSG